MSLFSFYFNDLSIGESGVLKSPTIIMRSSMCVLSFSKISFMDVGALAFGVYMLRIETLFFGGFFSFDGYEFFLTFFLLFVAEILFFGC